MIDHIGLKVSNYARSKLFFQAALAPLGYSMMMEFDMPEGKAGGLGTGGRMPDFWLSQGDVQKSAVHVAFAAENRTTVDAFYKAALAAGGKDNGPPGLREHYHAHYYGAFIIDPDGNNVEAVCHKPA